MKKILLLATLLFFAAPLNAALDEYADQYEARVTRVIEAGTLEAWVPIGEKTYAKLTIRVRGVETPGYNGRAKCTREWRAGDKAKEFTQRLIGDTKWVTLTNIQYRVRHSRALANIKVRDRDLASALLGNGHAIPYDTGPRKHWWCQ